MRRKECPVLTQEEAFARLFLEAFLSKEEVEQFRRELRQLPLKKRAAYIRQRFLRRGPAQRLLFDGKDASRT